MTSTQLNETVKKYWTKQFEDARVAVRQWIDFSHWLVTVRPSIIVQYSQFIQNNAVISLFPNMAADFITRVSFVKLLCRNARFLLRSSRTLGIVRRYGIWRRRKIGRKRDFDTLHYGNHNIHFFVGILVSIIRYFCFIYFLFYLTCNKLHSLYSVGWLDDYGWCIGKYVEGFGRDLFLRYHIIGTEVQKKNR
jgi:hypothetical protein